MRYASEFPHFYRRDDFCFFTLQKLKSQHLWTHLIFFLFFLYSLFITRFSPHDNLFSAYCHISVQKFGSHTTCFSLITSSSLFLLDFSRSCIYFYLRFHLVNSPFATRLLSFFLSFFLYFQHFYFSFRIISYTLSSFFYFPFSLPFFLLCLLFFPPPSLSFLFPLFLYLSRFIPLIFRFFISFCFFF
ncbi:unnamed protein product [Acanthosepion pharaonis]|uniref:Uncharacterized protein n=1 Tax=Acanthosepion pharaonis TaxID=158019 RepID=A0A812BFL6_ACAPH|nr:unnamed protein product [Sepia pharaonis]